MTRFTPPYFVKLFLSLIILSFTSCASEMLDSDSKEIFGAISTSISVEQVKATGNENLSRGETKAPEMRTFKVEGAKGEMYMRYTAAAGISGKEYSELDTEESRGKMITTADFYDSYGLFMYDYSYAYNWTTASTTATPTVANEEVLKAMLWKTNEYWPGAGRKLALYGYAPYNATGITNLPTTSTVGKPKFHYVVPAEAIDQKDLLVSEDDEFVTSTNENGGVDVPGNYNAIKTLKFKHACTAVRIAVGDQMAPCTITKIAIKGVYGEADYNYGANDPVLNQGDWEIDSTTLYNYSITKDFDVSATDYNKVINDGKYTFMLLPQIVPENAVLEITVNDGEEHVLKASIEGSDWKMGYSVTYFLTTSSVNEEYVLLVSSPDTQISSAGGTASFSIRSYKQTFYGSQVDIPWTLSYNYDDDVLGTSDWLGSTNNIVSGLSFSGTGGSVGESENFQVAKQVERSKTWRSTHTATLRAAAEQGTESSPVDLSAGKQTANCYVVSAPGYYKIPLVYGNARNADGTANEIAYNPNSSTFVDHNGVHITSPYIYETNGGANVPGKAILVWQDAPQIITPNSVKLSDDKHYIEFQVEKKNICQGNSVLAVCDVNGTIMWSWHIWVTDHSMTNTIEVQNNPSAGGSVISHFMEVPLGFCDKEVRVRDKRTFNFKVKQTDNDGKTATITFEQLSEDSLYIYGNNAPYYQFGRKDPMLPSDGMADEDKFYYDNHMDWNTTSGFVSTAVSIQNPFTFYYKNRDDWSSEHKYDYWNINFTEATNVNNTAVEKTIFDPSVSGFCMPRTAAFTGFTTTGNNTNNSSEFNVSGNFDEGWNFYTGANGDTIFFFALGSRDTSNGVVGGAQTDGDYWTSGANSTTLCPHLNFFYGRVWPQYMRFRSFGYSVRSVLEDRND